MDGHIMNSQLPNTTNLPFVLNAAEQKYKCNLNRPQESSMHFIIEIETIDIYK